MAELRQIQGYGPNEIIEAILHKLENEFERALESVLMRVFSMEKGIGISSGEKLRENMPPVAVAYSGGLDSTVLLTLSSRIAEKKGFPLLAFHVHHGLNREADAWLAHCRKICAEQNIGFDSCRVVVDRKSGQGIEAEARRQRYIALNTLCRQHGVQLLLTAHHQDDQAETVLLQLMRGTGIAGMAGMAPVAKMPESSSENRYLGRPLLSISRERLAQWAHAEGLTHVEDDSNDDVHYTRNAIRHELVPVLSRIFPGFGKRLEQTAQHMRYALDILNHTGMLDLQACTTEIGTLDLGKASVFDVGRMDNLLRCWLAANGLNIPSVAWFEQMKRQLLCARPDAAIELPLDRKIIRRYRTEAIVGMSAEEDDDGNKTVDIRWNGEEVFVLAAWRGKLFFDSGESGIDPVWLKKQTLQVRPYSGNAMLKLPKRPTRKLKLLCQEAGIAPWQRKEMPLVYIGDTLVFAAMLGQSVKYAEKGKKGIRLRWECQEQVSFKRQS